MPPSLLGNPLVQQMRLSGDAVVLHQHRDRLDFPIISNPRSPKMIFKENQVFLQQSLSHYSTGCRVNANKHRRPLQQHQRTRLHSFKPISFDRVRACFVFAGQLCG